MSITFEQLLTEKKATAKWVRNFIINTDKTGKSKQTAGYLGTRLPILEGYWDDLTRTHRSLMRFPEFVDSEYATTEEYETSVDEYATAKTELEACLVTLSNASTSTSDSTPIITTTASQNFREFHAPESTAKALATVFRWRPPQMGELQGSLHIYGH